jgi:tripartite-type tricarboxylate transporter receptor subunit TctC
MTLIGKPQLPANNYKELKAWVTQNKGQVNLANAGLASASQLCGMLWQATIQVELATVPYKGTAPAMTDLIGGQVQAMLNNLMAGSALIKGNKLKVLAVTSLTRSAALPNVATVVESVFPNSEVVSWYGVFLPAKTPEAVVNQLSRAIHVSLSDKELLQRLSKDGATAIGSTPQEFAEFFSADKAKWQKVASKLNITLD